jgi:hypothetical protein
MPDRRAPLLRAISTIALVSLMPTGAGAIEFRLDGYQRVRAQLYDNFSLTGTDDGLPREQTRFHLQHRLRVEPHLRVNPYVDVFAQADLLDGLLFGSNPAVESVPGVITATGETWLGPPSLSGSVLPGSGTATGFIKRAWMEIQAGSLPLRFRAGRMPNHWGSGLVYNDGEGWDADYGDSVDRIEASFHWQDMILVRAAFDSWLENFVNARDDVHGFVASAGYLGEIQSVGLLFETRWGPPADPFRAQLVNLWGQTRLGPLNLELEGALQWGGGSGNSDAFGTVPGGVDALRLQSGFDQVSLLSGGLLFRGEVDLMPVLAGVEFVMASGDGNINDEVAHTFVVDRDRDIGLLLFEHPLPAFQVAPEVRPAGSNNIDISQAVVHEGVANALVLGPYVQYTPYEALDLRLRFNAAWAFAASEATNEERFYGTDWELSGTWLLWDSLTVGARFGLMVPGRIFPDSNRRVLFGGELRAMVDFN